MSGRFGSEHGHACPRCTWVETCLLDCEQPDGRGLPELCEACLLDPTTPEDMVDEELRRAGIDPVELAARGAAIADAVKRGGT